MTIPLLQGEITIERMCVLAGVSRAGYYRHWAASAPRVEETSVRNAIRARQFSPYVIGYVEPVAERAVVEIAQQGFFFAIA